MNEDLAWRTLGDQLIARRVELGYPKRKPFALANGLTHDRTLSDMENCKRRNFDDSTIALVERIYRWSPGSIQQILRGGSATPLSPDTQPHRTDTVAVDVPVEVIDGLNRVEVQELVTDLKLRAFVKAAEIKSRPGRITQLPRADQLLNETHETGTIPPEVLLRAVAHNETTTTTDPYDDLDDNQDPGSDEPA